MKDKTSIARLDLLHPLVRDDFRRFIDDAEADLNITIRIVQGMRTFAEQQAIYDQGRTKPGKIVSNAKPGSSFHNYGLAIDIGVVEGKNINWGYDDSKFLPFASPYGIEWGGSWRTFKDYPHFQKTFNLGWKDCLARYQAKNFIAGTSFINIGL